MKYKYKTVKLPLEVYEQEVIRLNKINEKLKQLTKKDNKIKMTEYFRLKSTKPVFIYDEELLKYFIKEKNKGKRMIL